MKKKIIQILMAILFAMPGMAQTVALEDITEAVPGPVTVDLTFSNLTNVGAITLYIEYDDVLLGYSGPSQMTFLGSTMLINTMSNHRLGLSWFNTAGQNITTAVIPLQFDYLGGFSSDFHFMQDCEIATNTGALINATYIDGSIDNHDWTDIDGAVGFYWYDAVVGEQMVIPLLREGYTSGPVSFEEVSSITLFIEFDPAMLTYQGVVNNIHGFSVSHSNGLLSLTWSSIVGEDFRFFDKFLDLIFTYNGGTAALNFQSGSMVTSGTEILTTYFVDSYIFPEAVAANLTIANVVSAGATFELVPPTNDTLWLPVQVEVPVTASGITSSAGAIAINMVYDADKLTYTGYTAGSLSGWTVSHSEGQLSFLKTNASGMAIPDGTLFTLKFDYLTGVAPIEFRPGTFLQEPDLSYIPVNLNNGLVTSNPELRLTVFLEGPYNGSGTMSTYLNDQNKISLTDPYGGTETVGSIPADVVDWVYVELRDADLAANATPATIVWEGPLFLKKDGSIVALDGINYPTFNGSITISNGLFLVVKHRNHLAIMSSIQLTKTGTYYEYDFTDALTKAYKGSLGFLELEPGVFGMITGDADQDGQVASSDFIQYILESGTVNTYINTDFDFDLDVSTSDFIKWVFNSGFISQVPE